MSGSTRWLRWAVGAALRKVRLQAEAGEIELQVEDGEALAGGGWSNLTSVRESENVLGGHREKGDG